MIVNKPAAQAQAAARLRLASSQANVIWGSCGGPGGAFCGSSGLIGGKVYAPRGSIEQRLSRAGKLVASQQRRFAQQRVKFSSDTRQRS